MLSAEIIFVAINFLILAFFITKFYQTYIPSDCRVFFMISVFTKILLTAIFALIYNYYFPYQTDVQVQFMKAVMVKKYFLGHPEQFFDIYFSNSVPEIYFEPSRTNFFIKILSILQLITQDNNWINHAWFATLSFLSCWYLCIKLKLYYPESFISIVIALFFIPVPIIWSCGVLKDSFAFSSLALLLTVFIDCIQTRQYVKYLFLSILPSYLILQLKFYVLGTFTIIFIPALIFSALRNSVIKNKVLNALAFVVLVCLLGLFMNVFAIKFYSADIPALIFYNYEMFLSSGSNHFSFKGFNEQTISFLPHILTAFFQGLFMPLPGASTSVLMLIESWFNLTTAILTIITIYVAIVEKYRIGIMFILAMLYITINAIAFGFSTPNWGTLSRYKLYYIPFYHFIIVYILLNSSLGTVVLSWVRRFRLF